MDPVTRSGEHDSDDDLYSPPPARNDAAESPPASLRAQTCVIAPSHCPEPPSPPLSTDARSATSGTATTARSIASTALSTLATSSHTSNMGNGDAKDAAAVHARQQQHPPPKTTILDLRSDTATSSALPQPFGFSISLKGRMLAVFSARNIWLVQADKLPRTFMRTLEVRRKPVAVEILDDGSLLAVLSNPHKVDLYRLQSGDSPSLEKFRSVILGVDANTIALSPDGMVLATGYQYGIELISLAEKASENDRRSVNCDPMDHLSFSDDGRTLLASASARLPRPTTVFSVHGAFDGPFTEDGELIPQECHVAWTRQILFPEKAITAKQALLLPDMTTGQVNELFAFDAEEDSWGVYDLSGMQFVETKEHPPQASRYMRAESLEDALPAVSPSADHVAVAVKQHDSNSIWIYRLPDRFEPNSTAYTDLKQHSEQHSPLAPCACISVERNRDTSAQDIAVMRWITPPVKNDIERLLAVGNVVWNTTPDTPVMPGETAKTSGILIMMDFDFSHVSDAGGTLPEKVTIDLDETLPGEKLPEDELEFEREVELVRTRTVAQRRGEAARAMARTSLLRSSAANSPQSANRMPNPHTEDDNVPIGFEEPYSHGQPRSQMSLNRAATVAAASPANRRHLRALPDQPLEYRRADGAREIPHESDADNWEPPPPPYTPNADPPGPGAISISLSHSPFGMPLPTIPSPPAQHASLPRLQIPADPHHLTTPCFPSSAPTARHQSGTQSALPYGPPEAHSALAAHQPHSALPVHQSHSVLTVRQPQRAGNDSYRFSHPPSHYNVSSRPPTSRHHTAPNRPATSPSPTRERFQYPHMSGVAHPSRPQSRPCRSPGPSAYQVTSQTLEAQYMATPPSPSGLSALHRRDSVPTPNARAGLGAIGLNHRAALSADDLPSRTGRRVRSRTGLSRLATIRSTQSGWSDGRRASAPNLVEINERQKENYRAERKRSKCVVM